MNQADAALARRWAENGDREAMRELYERHSRRVFAFARSMTGSEDAAAEVLQETFLRAARGMSRFKGESEFSTWLLAVAKSAAGDLGRRAQRRERDQKMDPPERVNPEPADHLGSRELTEAVRQAVLRLPEAERLAVTLCELQELPLQEAGAVLGWTEGKLKSTLWRARGRLKKQLECYAS
ncbi:MAG TPA: RNA polymerase sigma factor [Planctomycetota bacterium]|nr:RNA polymerase sigma factor [Planctomycetota bacterium]